MIKIMETQLHRLSIILLKQTYGMEDKKINRSHSFIAKIYFITVVYNQYDIVDS